MNLLRKIAFCFLLGAVNVSGWAMPPTTDLKVMRQLLTIPEDKLDLALAKLKIDHLIDPSVDIDGTLKKLDAIAGSVRARVPLTAPSRDVEEDLRYFLFKAGLWNDNRPFQYDLDDPFGHIIHNKLLSTYLESRKGNCVSMPILFLLLGQKLGLDIKAATIPEHIYLIYHYDQGQVINIEATSGGFKLDSSYRRDSSMTDEAIANGIYMKPLSKRETVELMAETLMEFYEQKGQQEQRMALANLILEFDPKNVVAMLVNGSASAGIIRRDFVSKYPTPKDIPADQRPRFMELRQANEMWYKRAEALGWREPSQAQDARYMQSVEREKKRKAQGE